MEEDEERSRIEEMREIEMEELQVEEVDEADISYSDESMNLENDGRVDESGDIMYDLCLVSMDSRFDEVVDSHRGISYLKGGAILNLPMFYIEGVVLFPEATLPLRVTKPRFRASLEKALNHIVAPGTVGVVYVYEDHENETLHFSSVGTTAEIQKYCLLKDGSVNVLIRGKQRFHLRHRWIDPEGAPCAEVQIIQEDLPLRTPREAVGQLASITNIWKCSLTCQVPMDASRAEYFCSKHVNDSESSSETSFENDLSPQELQLHQSATKSCERYYRSNESTSSCSSQFACESSHEFRRSPTYDSGESSKHKFYARNRKDSSGLGSCYHSVLGEKLDFAESWKVGAAVQLKLSRKAQKSFWPHWVYRMYDSYSLAQRASVMWKQIIGTPSMDEHAKRPDVLSFTIASQIPVSESLKQELLEIDGVSHRLRREIEYLERFDCVHCKTCQSVIAKQSEILVLSGDGPLGAYANIHGYVHEIKAFHKANGLAHDGPPSEEYSWFSGYAWAVATCVICKSVMGWFFTATHTTLMPDSFWAIWNARVANNNC